MVASHAVTMFVLARNQHLTVVNPESEQAFAWPSERADDASVTELVAERPSPV